MNDRDVIIEKDGIVHVLHLDEDGIPTEKKKESREDQYKLIMGRINGDSNVYNRATCYYCGIPLENNAYSYEQTLYEIKSLSYLPMGYKYFKRKVVIPRCEICSQKHSNYLLIFNFIPLVLTFVVVFIALFESFANIIAYALVAFSVASLVVLIFQLISGGFLFKVIYKIPNCDDTKDYPVVRELLKLGLKKNKPINCSRKDLVTDDKDWLISKIISMSGKN